MNALTRWNPFRELDELRNRLSRFLGKDPTQRANGQEEITVAEWAPLVDVFRNSIRRFHMNPQMDIFKDDAGYSLSLDVRELKDRFQVRAFLLDTKASEAKVTLTGNRLEVEIIHQQMENQQNTNSLATGTEWGRYTQMVELHGTLKSD